MKKQDKQLHIRVSPEVYKRLKVKCAYTDTSMQDYVANLISEQLGEYSAEARPAKELATEKQKGTKGGRNEKAAFARLRKGVS